MVLMTKKNLFILVKLLLSSVLIAYLLHRIPLQDILVSLSKVNLLWMLLALLLAGLGKVISSLRWRFLLAAQDIHVPFHVLFASLLVGYFFNNFLPSTIGGDAMRAFDVARYSRRGMASVVTVITERVMGILALAAIAMLAALAGYHLIRPLGFIFYVVTAFFLVSLGGFYFITHRRIVEQVVRLLIMLKLAKVGKKIEEAYAAFCTVRNQPGVLRKTFLISVVLQLNVLIYYYVISLSLNLGVPVFYFFCIIPVILVVLQLPISINGIGVRESLYVYFLGLVAVAGPQAIAFSWIDFAMTVIMGLLGGIVFAFRRSIPSPPLTTASLE
jgi:glycosyltransferase 2 family protein